MRESLTRCRQCSAGRWHDLDDVGAGGQAVERVEAVRVRGRRGEQVAIGVEEVHHDTRDTALAAVTDAVAVGVGPHGVADRTEILAEVGAEHPAVVGLQLGLGRG